LTLSARSQEIYSDQPPSLTRPKVALLNSLSYSHATHATDDIQSLEPPEPPLLDPNPRHILDPNRGAPFEDVIEEDPPLLTEIVPADDALINLDAGHDDGPLLATDTTESESNDSDSNRAISKAAELVEVRNTINSGYQLQNPTKERHVF
jgi:hypothetical protein